MNPLKKQTNIPRCLKEFFRPTRDKLVALCLLFIPFLLLASIQLGAIILGHGGVLDLITPFFIYAIIMYFIACTIFYITRKFRKPQIEEEKPEKKNEVKKRPLTWEELSKKWTCLKNK